MQHLASYWTSSTLLCSQTTSILSSSSTHSQHYLHSTGGWFWLLTVSLVKASTFECFMCLESTTRLLMCCLTFRMTSLLLCTLSLSSWPFNPLELHRGNQAMSLLPFSQARQPPRAAWSMECPLVEHSITLGCVLDQSTRSMYLSALNSYLTFCQLHHLNPDPTINTLHYISPSCLITSSLIPFAHIWLALSMK